LGRDIGYTTARSTCDDLEPLCEFRRRVYGPSDRTSDPRRVEWLYDANPFDDDQDPAIWLTRAAGEIVGTNAAIRFALLIDGDELPAQWGVDLYVDKAHRGHGIAATLNRALRAEGRLSCALGMSEQGLQHSLRNGYQSVATVPSYVLVLDRRPLSGRKLEAWASRTLGAARASAASMARGQGHRAGAPLDLEPVPRFDGRDDGIWQECRSHYRVIARRDAQYLAWRFDASPDVAEYRRYYLTRHDATVGYVVTRPKTWHGAPALVIVDYLAAPDDLEQLFRLIKEAARAQHAAAVLCPTLNAAAHGALQRSGFLSRAGSGACLTVRVAEDTSRFGALTDSASWFLTLADSDLD
jgi:GNAT superfamily N-acetyltransferase